MNSAGPCRTPWKTVSSAGEETCAPPALRSSSVSSPISRVRESSVPYGSQPSGSGAAADAGCGSVSSASV